MVEIYFEDGLFVVEDKELGSLSYSESFFEAISDYNNDIDFLKQEYMECDDDELSPCAIELKMKLKEIFSNM